MMSSQNQRKPTHTPHKPGVYDVLCCSRSLGITTDGTDGVELLRNIIENWHTSVLGLKIYAVVDVRVV